MHCIEHPWHEALVASHCSQRLHILWKATPTISGPRKEKCKSNPAVVANATTHVIDVGLHAFAEVRHFVNKADLGGQKCVGNILCHFRAFWRHHQKWILCAQKGGVKISEYVSDVSRSHAYNHAVGLLKILDRRPFLEKLRVACHAANSTGAREQPLLNSGAGAHGHSAFGDDHGQRVEVGCNRVDHCPEGRQIGRTIC